MIEKRVTAAGLLGAFMLVVTCYAIGPAQADVGKVNVFERFRIEMAFSPRTTAARYMNPAALANWNNGTLPYFTGGDKELSHFFALAMIVPKVKGADFYAIYFNPWVDGVLLTQWKKEAESWKIERFYLASGERLRGQATPQAVITNSNIPPAWMWQKGGFVQNILSYYKDMRARLVYKTVEQYQSWFSLDDIERKADLLRVMLRMRARVVMNAGFFAKDKGGALLTGAISKLKYDLLTRDTAALSSYSKDASLLVKLTPDIIKTLRQNWVFYNNGVYSLVISSPVAPRFFILMDVGATGRIRNAGLNDLESMASALPQSASTVRYAKPAASAIGAPPTQPARKVQTYTNANGERVEIITEKRGGKVTMTTRINGVITEVLTF